MLEQIAYEVAPRLQRPQSQSTYQVSYLENLSATALYRGSSQDPSDGGGSNPPIQKTIQYGGYIESMEVDSDGKRYSFATSTRPENFGEMSLKIQEKGQSHKSTEYRDI
ncbi:MAG: hypothetical protein ABEJ02_02585 [Candidatus Paceibacteria bacterium]